MMSHRMLDEMDKELEHTDTRLRALTTRVQTAIRKSGGQSSFLCVCVCACVFVCVCTCACVCVFIENTAHFLRKWFEFLRWFLGAKELGTPQEFNCDIIEYETQLLLTSHLFGK